MPVREIIQSIHSTNIHALGDRLWRYYWGIILKSCLLFLKVFQLQHHIIQSPVFEPLGFCLKRIKPLGVAADISWLPKARTHPSHGAALFAFALAKDKSENGAEVTDCNLNLLICRYTFVEMNKDQNHFVDS